MVTRDPSLDFITVVETAKILMLSEYRTRLLLREGKFPNAKKPGKSWMIPRQDVYDYIESSKGDWQ